MDDDAGRASRGNGRHSRPRRAPGPGVEGGVAPAIWLCWRAWQRLPPSSRCAPRVRLRPARCPLIVQPPAPVAPRPEPAPSVDLARRGVEAARSGAVGEAVDAFKKALAANDRDAGTWNNLGVALVRQGSWAEAIEAFRRAVQARAGTRRGAEEPRRGARPARPSRGGRPSLPRLPRQRRRDASRPRHARAPASPSIGGRADEPTLPIAGCPLGKMLVNDGILSDEQLARRPRPPAQDPRPPRADPDRDAADRRGGAAQVPRPAVPEGADHAPGPGRARPRRGQAGAGGGGAPARGHRRRAARAQAHRGHRGSPERCRPRRPPPVHRPRRGLPHRAGQRHPGGHRQDVPADGLHRGHRRGAPAGPRPQPSASRRRPRTPSTSSSSAPRPTTRPS